MLYCLHETVVMATEELAAGYNKHTSTFDAGTLVPYLLMVVIKGF
jgi:hypothetical protein